MKSATNKKAVICIETGVSYPSMTAAAAAVGLSRAAISQACAGHINSAGGFHWRYKDATVNHCPGQTKKAVICVETGHEYPSVSAAAVASGLWVPNIIATCKGRNKTSGGFHWRYKDAVENSVVEPIQIADPVAATPDENEASSIPQPSEKKGIIGRLKSFFSRRLSKA